MIKLEEINNLAFDLTNEELEPYDYFQIARKVYNLSKPVELNENQQIVLNWMKRDLPNLGVDSLLCELTFLSCTGGWMKNEVTARAYRNLSDIERLQVLQALAEWGLGHEAI